MAMNLSNVVRGVLVAIVGLTIIVTLASVLLPEAQTAGNTLNATGISLASLFASNGILWVLFVVGLFLFGVKVALEIAKG